MANASDLFLSEPGQAGNNACLVHIYPTEAGGACHLLSDRPVVIGRDPEADVRITDDSVSRRHAIIQPDDDGFSVVDSKSTNGTFVNDVRVTQRKLQSGDYLHIGTSIFRFLAGGTVEAAYHEEIYRLTIIDALTDVPNKRFFLERLEHELSRSARYQRPLALILFDLDHFKNVNDTHGHLAGDFALREMALTLKTVLRKEDLLARYGGEEFIVLLPETPPENAPLVAENLRKAAEDHLFRFESKTLPITISLGVAGTTGGAPITADELIQKADAKLYEAKNAGRNRVGV